MTIIQSGSINEAGFIRGLKRKGFNLNRALSELIQNSIDANAENICILKDKNFIKLIDNGIGMSQQSLRNMWDVYPENHSGQESGGVSGLGSKPSTYIASKQTEVFVFTKSSNDQYYKAKVPWDLITTEQKYIGMVEITVMNQTEIDIFKEIIPDTGTIIQFKYNHDLYNCIDTQFNHSKRIVDISQRIDWIFAKFPAQIKLQTDEDPITTLQKYNYFGCNLNDYYLINEYTISVFKQQNESIIFAHKLGENNYEYYRKPSTRWTKASFEEFRECIPIGTIKIKCGMRKDDDYFDYSQPNMPNAQKKLLSYDSNYFEAGSGINRDTNGDEIKLSLWQPHLSRNSQYIGVIPSLPTLNPASARADGRACLIAHHIRTDINYNVYSSQNNIMDEIIGIQENKNQLNTYNMDQSFLRLIESLMKETGTEIWNNFQDRCDEVEQAAAAAAAAAEVETISEESSDDDPSSSSSEESSEEEDFNEGVTSDNHTLERMDTAAASPGMPVDHRGPHAPPEYDHIQPFVDGGVNEQSNIQLDDSVPMMPGNVSNYSEWEQWVRNVLAMNGKMIMVVD